MGEGQGRGQGRGRSRDDVLRGCLCAIGASTLFGLSYLFTKSATETVEPLVLLAWRFMLAFAAMSAMRAAGLLKVDLRGKHVMRLLPMALCQPVVYYVCETVGVSLTSASESSAIVACIPIATLVSSALVLGERPSRGQTAGVCVTIVGVLVCVLSKGTGASFSVTGYLMLAIAVVAYALFTVLSERESGFTSVEKTYVMTAVGAPVFVVAAVVEGLVGGDVAALVVPLSDPGLLIAVGYLGLGCSVVAFVLSNRSIALAGSNRSISFVGVGTVVSVVSGVLVLGESFTLAQTVGTILILGGVYLANWQVMRGLGSRETTGR